MLGYDCGLSRFNVSVTNGYLSCFNEFEAVHF